MVPPTSYCKNKSHRPWIPPRPIAPPLGYLVDGDQLIIPGLAVVLAAPHRTPQQARGFARRIAAEPAAYLDILTAFNVPGIVDRRPVSHARGGSPSVALADVIAISGMTPVAGKAVGHGR